MHIVNIIIITNVVTIFRFRNSCYDIIQLCNIFTVVIREITVGRLPYLENQPNICGYLCVTFTGKRRDDNVLADRERSMPSN